MAVLADAAAVELLGDRVEVDRLAGRTRVRPVPDLGRRLEVVALQAAPAVRDAVRARRDVLDVALRAVVGPVARLLRRREVVAVRAATAVIEGIHTPPDGELRVNCCGRECCGNSK